MAAFSIKEHFPMKDWEVMDSFISKNYGKNHIMRNKKLFQWFFCRELGPEKANVISAYHDDEFIGLLGYIPTNFLWGYDGKIVRGIWLANWMVQEEFRTGIGALLIRKAQELYPLVAGAGANLTNKKIVSKLGFRFFDNIKRYIRILDPEPLRRIGIYVEHENMSKYVSTGLPERDNVNIKFISGHFSKADFDPEPALYSSFKFGTLRDRDYVQERYLDFPFFDYKVRVCGEASSPSLLIYRIERTSGMANFKVGRILELLFPDTDSGKEQISVLLAEMYCDLKQEAVVFVDFFCSLNLYSDWLPELGLIMEEDKVLPNLLNPIVLEEKDQNLEIWTAKDLPICRLDDMYVTKSDGDQDRPN